MHTPYISYRPRTALWEVLADYEFHGYSIDLLIPQGFVCDLASIPRLLWRIIAPHELGIVAPLVHDWLYRHGGRHQSGTVDRLAADGIFREIMIAEGVAPWRRVLAYRAVRLFGWRAWKAAAASCAAPYAGNP